MKRICMLVACFVLVSSIYSQENQNVTVKSREAKPSSKMGLSLRLGGGYGWSLYGVVVDTKSVKDLGISENSYSGELAGMFNYDIWATESQLFLATIKDPEVKVVDTNTGNSTSFTQHGSGSFALFDQRLGVKLFSKPGDMGYTFFYANYHFWRSSFTKDSGSGNALLYTGMGAGIGVRDISTLSLGGMSLLLHTGAWVGFAPAYKREQGNSKDNIDWRQSITAGGEVGVGTAIESIGLAVFFNVKAHLHYTEFRLENLPEGGNMVGIGGIWVGGQAIKDFAF